MKKWWGWVKKNEFSWEKAMKKVRGSTRVPYLLQFFYFSDNR